MGNSCKKVVVVGGGITGLSAAFYTQKLFEERQISVEITIVEKGQELGGKIRTLYRDGFIIERGQASFMSRKLPMITLTKELGLEFELTATNPQAKTNYILNKGRLHKMPHGFILGVPKEITPLHLDLVEMAAYCTQRKNIIASLHRAFGIARVGPFYRRTATFQSAQGFAGYYGYCGRTNLL
jgi:oxygen-dependent protoporphyrinogen oxidase